MIDDPEEAIRPVGAPGVTGALSACCPVVELRQYTLRPGRREGAATLAQRSSKINRTHPPRAVG